MTAEVVGVGYSLLKSWKRMQWWEDLEKEIQAGFRIKQNSSISTIVEKGLDVIKDRLENGEVVLDQKSGELVRRPVALRDAATATSNLMQRQSVLEKAIADEHVGKANETIQEQLAFLATEFAKFNNRSKLGAEDIEFIEVETHAIHEEREAGLQEGSSTLYLETESEEEAGDPECSPSEDDEEGFSPQR